jgi:hypothetical protein
MFSGVERGALPAMSSGRGGKILIPSSRDGDIAGACDGTALLLSLSVSDSRSSTNGLGKTVVQDSTAGAHWILGRAVLSLA